MKNKFNLNILFLLPMFAVGCNQQAQSDKPFITDASQIHEITATKKTPPKFKTVKPHAAIFMQYEFLNSLQLNETLDIKLSFNVGYDVESLRVDYFTSEGISVENTQTEFLFNKVPKSNAQILQLSVVPVQFGEHIITVSATIETLNAKQSRSFEIAVNLYSKDLQKSQNNKSRQGMKFIPDHNVISMPATETTQ